MAAHKHINKHIDKLRRDYLLEDKQSEGVNAARQASSEVLKPKVEGFCGGANRFCFGKMLLCRESF